MVACETCKGQGRIVEDAGWQVRVCPACRGLGQVPGPAPWPRHWWRR
jgi:DnaJ-class molecular chaperone